MSNFDIHIKKIKSVRAHIRDAAALDLCRMVILNDCEDDEVGVVVAEIKKAFSGLGVESRGMAADVLMKNMTADEIHDFLWTELGYAYEQLRSGHAYLEKILYMVCQNELGDTNQMGDYFNIDKQFKLAFDLLKSVDSGALKQ